MKIWDRFLDYLFRRKTLKSCLYILIIAIIGELTALSNGEAVTSACRKYMEDHQDDFSYYIASLIDFLFGTGNWIVLGILVLLFSIICYLIYRENSNDSGMKWESNEW